MIGAATAPTRPTACAASTSWTSSAARSASISPWSTVPAGEAESTVQRLGAAGVKAVLNFAPVKVHAPEGVLVRQVDLSSELMSLSFYLDKEQD